MSIFSSRSSNSHRDFLDPADYLFGVPEDSLMPGTSSQGCLDRYSHEDLFGVYEESLMPGTPSQDCLDSHFSDVHFVAPKGSLMPGTPTSPRSHNLMEEQGGRDTRQSGEESYKTTIEKILSRIRTRNGSNGTTSFASQSINPVSSKRSVKPRNISEESKQRANAKRRQAVEKRKEKITGVGSKIEDLRSRSQKLEDDIHKVHDLVKKYFETSDSPFTPLGVSPLDILGNIHEIINNPTENIKPQKSEDIQSGQVNIPKRKRKRNSSISEFSLEHNNSAGLALPQSQSVKRQVAQRRQSKKELLAHQESEVEKLGSKVQTLEGIVENIRSLVSSTYFSANDPYSSSDKALRDIISVIEGSI